MIRIDRKEYLNFLIESKDKQIIKVVSGVRRCGKSTLFEIYKDYLLKSIIRKNVALSECIVTHQSIFDYSKKSNGAKDYSNLAEEIMKKEGIR